MQVARRRRQVSRGFNPATQFAPALNGLWYDPSDYTTLSQDSAGTTPVTAVTQPVGRMLDKSGRNNTILQATATSRPLQSARVNLLTKSEQFDDAVWAKQAGASVTPNTTTAPDGTLTADTVTQNGAYIAQIVSFAAVAGVVAATSVYLKANAPTTVTANYNGAGNGANNALGTTAFSVTTAWQRFTHSKAIGAADSGLYILLTGTAGQDFQIWGAQFELNIATPTRYQRVDTASSYDTVGFPQYQTFDGVDDGLATGAITLSADMDCFIAVRRNSAAQLILVSNSTGGAQYFGYAVSGAAASTFDGVGTPTLAINGVVVASPTGGNVFTAMTQSAWVVFEVRNLNLLAWTGFNLSNYTTFQLNGDFGGIILAPAGDATARQNNRRQLGTKVGLNLP